MSPITMRRIRHKKREESWNLMQAATNRIIPGFILAGFIYFVCHIAMWYFKGMPVPH